MIFGRHVEETLIFQREFKKKIARADRQEQGKKKHRRRKDAHGPECRYQEKSANAEADDRQESANPSSQELLKPGVANLVSQQDAESLSGVDQITERTLWMNRDQFAAQHVGRPWDGRGRFGKIDFSTRTTCTIFIINTVLCQIYSLLPSALHNMLDARVVFGVAERSAG